MSDQSPKFKPDEAPTLEIGPDADLMSLSHEEQVEIALAALDELPAATGEQVLDLAEGLGREVTAALADISPDPDFLIVGPEEVAVVEERPTIIPEIPITMEDLEPIFEDENSRPTRPYPPEFKYIGEFMTSKEMHQYETALSTHRQAIERYFSRINCDSRLPEPPHFQDYFHRYLILRAGRIGNETSHAPVSIAPRATGQSGRYSLLLSRATDEKEGRASDGPGEQDQTALESADSAGKSCLKK